MNHVKLAFRNIFRHRKRSFVTICTICLGFTALGVMSGMVNNIYSRLKGQAIVAEKLGHLTIAKKNFFDQGKIEPEKFLFEEAELKQVLNIIQSDPSVLIATPRLNLFGIATNGNASTIFLTEGIDPKDDQQLVHTNIDGRTNTQGAIVLEANKSKDTGVAIGAELAKNLGLELGDYLTLFTNTKDGLANAVETEITQIFNTGNPATNDKFVLSDIQLARSLYDTDGAQRIVVTVTNDKEVEIIKTRLLEKLSQQGYQVEAKSWSKMSLFYDKIKATFGAIFRVLTMIITIVILLTLLNTMQMAVMERTKEIGTMRAMGMTKKQIVFLFCSEGILLTISGCLLAIPVLLFISKLLELLNITFIPPVASVAVSIALLFQIKQLALVSILFILASFIASYITSNRISKQKVVDTLVAYN